MHSRHYPILAFFGVINLDVVCSHISAVFEDTSSVITADRCLTAVHMVLLVGKALIG